MSDIDKIKDTDEIKDTGDPAVTAKADIANAADAPDKTEAKAEGAEAKPRRGLKISARSIAFTALLTAIVCVLSPITIPIGPVPISLGTLAIYIVCSVLDWKHGLAAVTAFIALGMMGVPVFTGYANGWARIPGPTGGYIIGYIPMAIIIGLIVDRFDKHLAVYPLAMTAGTAVLYTFGTAWFVLWMKTSVGAALMACVVPFLVIDLCKIILSSVLAYKLRFLLRRVINSGKRASQRGGKP